MAEHEEHDKHAGGKAHGGGGHGGGGHGGGGHAEGEEGGAPEWLISFADNVTLMMAFFVILLAMNLKEPTTGGIGGKDKNPSSATNNVLDMSIAIRSAFNNPVNVNSTNPYDAPLVRRLRERQGTSGNAVQDGPAGQFDSVQALAPTDYYVPSGVVNFAFGSSELTAVAHSQIEQIVHQIRDLSYVIEVRGHASPYEVFRNEREGMQFSHERALAVAAALAELGVPWDNLRVVACSDGPPLSDRPRTREEGERSQIVEVITTGEAVKPRLAPAPPTGASPPNRTPSAGGSRH